MNAVAKNASNAITLNSDVGPVRPMAAYLAKQDRRTRFSFGQQWMSIVLSGVVQDRAKLVAHGVQLGLGKTYDLSVLKHETLVTRVQDAIMVAA